MHTLQEFLFFPVLWSSCYPDSLPFKAKYSGDSISQQETLRLESLTRGSELLLLWENLCDIIIFQFVGWPPIGYGVWLYHECTLPTILLWLLLCLWKYNILVGSSFPLWINVQLLVVILVFSWEVSQSLSIPLYCPRTSAGSSFTFINWKWEVWIWSGISWLISGRARRKTQALIIVHCKFIASSSRHWFTNYFLCFKHQLWISFWPQWSRNSFFKWVASLPP